jgi:hypothetical protein
VKVAAGHANWIRSGFATSSPNAGRGESPLFTSSGGPYRSNPLVVEHGLSIEDAKALDKSGKGGGLIDAKLVREFPLPIR